MSLVHDGVTLFGSHTHDDILEGPYVLPFQIGQYFGIVGETHIVGETKGRDLRCDIDAMGYSSRGGLISAITAIQALANRPLTGSLVIDFTDPDPKTFQSCTFVGLNPRSKPQYDVVDQSWWQELTFFWRQAK